MQLSRRLWLMIFVVVCIAAATLQLALSLPKANGEWQVSNQDILFSYNTQPFIKVDGFWLANTYLVADSNFLIPEPDRLDYLPDYFKLLSDVGHLSHALTNNQLALQTHLGPITITSSKRHLSDLSALFWLQWLCGLLALFICIVIWALRPIDLVIRLFMLSGLGYASSVLAAAIYSTRELFITTDLWRTLSFINHAGAFLYAAALCSLLWVYPLKLKGWRWALIIFFAASLLPLIANAFGLINYFSLISYSWILVVFSGGIIGTIWQWLLTRHKASERAVLRWLQLSVLAGTIFYTALGIIPVALNKELAAPQGVLLATFLLLYIGVAMGVLRYRLFDLERWSFNLWSWGISGLLVVALEFTFIGLLSWSNTVSIAVSVAVVGWLYFPVRQWVWRTLMGNQSTLEENWIKSALPQLIAVDLNQLPTALLNISKQVFKPLQLHFAPQTHTEVSIIKQGETLIIPLGQQQIELFHASLGRRLFNRDDVRTAEYLLQLKQLVAKALIAREQGAKDERQRIQQDIHDDLGAKLMGLLHQVPEAQQPLVRDSIRDMRQILRSLDGKNETLSQLFTRIKQECKERCHHNKIDLAWQASLAEPHILLVNKQISHIERVFREACSNAIKQKGAHYLHIDISAHNNLLTATIINDGCTSEQCAPRRGLYIMQRRISELNGTLTWQAQPPTWTLALSMPLPLNRDN